MDSRGCYVFAWIFFIDSQRMNHIKKRPEIMSVLISDTYLQCPAVRLAVA